ncbi:MAG: DNA methyltransferase, partial [Pontixanthobacter sp.]
MSPVEIEEAVEALVEQSFDREEFPFQFLLAFDTSDAAIRRLKSGSQNQSDIGGVLNRNNIHIATCDVGSVDETIAALRDSPKTASAKAKFVLATDGEIIQAQNMGSGEPLVCTYAELPDHFGFFLQLAGITTVKEIEESSFDIRATGRLNKLYVRLLEDNPDWASDERRPDMNHFMARLIFCFFAEDTDIFLGDGLFTKTVQQMSSGDASDAHTIISECFRAMDTKLADRKLEGIPRYAKQFPYVNGSLFSGDVEVPRFTKIARSYLIHIGNLDWTKINPDIFGSMIQAVADDEERGSLGMHYTSVPNILKVLNPLFLDDLRVKLEEAGGNGRKLLNLRNRMARIRVFDPACGSGNFLVIAYKEMRAIEFVINELRSEPERRSDIPLTNFRGIELRDFPAEIARLALIIAEYQCDVTYRGQQEALAEFLPLNSENWITCGNALRLDWLNICPPTGAAVKVTSDDLYDTPLDQSEIDFENEGGETYICGNPPYLGSTWQTKEQKEDLGRIFSHRTNTWKALDYVAGWLMKAADFGKSTPCVAAFVSTNSVCQGQQVPFLWRLIFETGNEIVFAHQSFKWSNLASHNAGVTVVIVGISTQNQGGRLLFSADDDSIQGFRVRRVENINPYLLASPNTIVEKAMKPLTEVSQMDFGNKADDGGHLTASQAEIAQLALSKSDRDTFVKRFLGSKEFI